MPTVGRRPGRSGSREHILRAARDHFARFGYDRATLRAMAADARVDPALVRHFFGSKHGVFLAAMRIPFDPALLIQALAAPGRDGIGERTVRTFVTIWDSPEGAPLRGLLRAVVADEPAADLMRAFVTREVFGRLAGALGVDRPSMRAGLVASQLLGIAILRYILRLEPFASATAEELAALAGPTVQRYFGDELPPIRTQRAAVRRKARLGYGR